MKKPALNRDLVKNKLSTMKGLNVKMKVNRGRKKIETFSAVIENIYPSVFTVKVPSEYSTQSLQSFAYTEIVCGNVKICKEK